MLILTRRIGETLRIGHEVSVTVLSVKGAFIRLGIAAPKEVTVHRQEVYERLQHERAMPVQPATVVQPVKVRLRRRPAG